jgi:RNA polymerase sigma-70 factor, ECF subfamily
MGKPFGDAGTVRYVASLDRPVAYPIDTLDSLRSIGAVGSMDSATVDPAYSAFFQAEFTRVTHAVDLIVRDRQAAEDIAQDAFTELLIRWPRISRYDVPEAWIRRIAIRRALRWARRERIRSVLLGWLEPPPPAPSSVDADLESAIRALSPQQRAAIVLHYFEDRPLPEVASLLGCSHATAKVHVFKARRRLAALLAVESRGAADGH